MHLCHCLSAFFSGGLSGQGNFSTLLNIVQILAKLPKGQGGSSLLSSAIKPKPVHCFVSTEGQGGLSHSVTIPINVNVL